MSLAKKTIIGILLIGGSVCSAAQFECQANQGLRHQREDSIKITGELDNSDELHNVALTLTSRSDGSDHDLVRVDGPVAADPKFQPKTAKLKGYQKFVLEKSKDSFQFFLPSSGDRTRAYVKLYFEGTYPDLEEVTCRFSVD